MADEYINRAKFCEYLRTRKAESADDYGRGWKNGIIATEKAARGFPAADVEPVVHCRDCKYQTKRWHSDKRFRHGGYYFYGCDNMGNSDLGQDNDFCARGERKIT